GNDGAMPQIVFNCFVFGALLATLSPVNIIAADQTTVRVVREVKGAADSKPLYLANRAPLEPSPFVKLPIGSSEPRGWLRHQLELERDGMVGRLKEISPLLTSLDAKPGKPATKVDLWPNMVMLNCLQSYHEFSGDKRVLELMTRYFKWEDQLPASAFGEGYWPKIRAGDNIESIYWLYNRTSSADAAWLLPLA